jgi:hypothetical protein
LSDREHSKSVPRRKTEAQPIPGGLAMQTTEGAAPATPSTVAAGATLNQKLTTWWELDFPAFRREVNKALRL